MSTKSKPVTPPKPGPARLTCLQETQTQKEEDDIYDRCMDTTSNQSNLLKRGSTLPPKPALYPKPQSPLTKPLEKVRPQIPRRPDHIVSSSDNNRHLTNLNEGVKRRSNLVLAKLKAPVAKLEEFDNLYDKAKEGPLSPVRPPRSPKIKAFLDGPFSQLDERPELPVKKRLLSNIEKEDKDWDNIKKRSASLGRSEVLASQGCLSLSRKLSLEDLTKIDNNVSQTKKPSPIPPPRRRKKSEDAFPQPVADVTPANFPVYAQVNYEMKKNRRSAALGQEVATIAVVEGRLLLTGNTLQSSNSLHMIDNIESEQIGVDKSMTTDKVNSMSVEISDLISRDKTEDNRNQACSMIPSNAYEEIEITSPPKQQFTDKDNSNGDTTGAVEMEATLVRQESGLFRIISSSSSEVKEVFSDKNVDLMVTTTEIRDDNLNDITSPAPRIDSYLHRNVSENTDEQNPKTVTPTVDASVKCGQTENAIVLTVNSSTSNLQEDVIASVNGAEVISTHPVVKRDQVSDNLAEAISVVQLNESATSHNPDIQNIDSDSVVHKNIGASESLCEAINTVALLLVDNSATTKETNPIEQISHTITDSVSLHNNSRPISSSEVSDISDLVLPESQRSQDPPKVKSRPKVNRRQSWSSSQETSPSPDLVAESKTKHRSGVPWCDEGDLSNGVLADSDTGSSDNMARRSTEDVNKRVNGGGYPVRSKIATWFDSFGKGAKKKERKMRTVSQLFPEGESKVIHVMRPAPSVPDQQEKQGEDRHHLTVQVQRTSSGVSDILDNIQQDRDSESDSEDLGPAVSPMTETQRKERRVFFIAQELMTSERQFVDVLKLLNVDFVNAVNAAGTEQSPVIHPSELAKILESLPQLQRLNEELLRDLELRIKNWSSYPKIADVIVKKGPFLKLFSSYIKNFGAQCKYLDDFCVKYPKFSKVVKEFEASPICKKLGVKHFMLKPVQRIPQYRLLLEDYQRKLDLDSLDYQDTEEALKIVRDVADHANQTIKLGDHLSKMMELQSQLVDYEIIKPGRLYLKDGELFKLSRKVRHPRYFILLNDCLLYTSRLNTSLLRVNKELPLAGMKVLVPQGEDNLNEFNIISVARSFTLSASCAEERREWTEALEKAIKDYTSRKLTFQAITLTPTPTNESLKLGHQAPVWIQDTRVTMCQSCTTQFTLTNRRHHCRACGKVVCGVCSEYRAPMRYDRFEAKRVCEDCYDTLLHEFSGPKKAIIDDLLVADFKNPEEAFESIKNSFKKLGTGSKKKLMQLNVIPQRLKEVAANDTGSQVSGWLQRKARRSWKTLWFVLKEQVLYVYKAQEDVVAHESIPILGYKVEAMAERHFELYEGIDAKLVFQLSHRGQQPLVFYAKDPHMANRWIKAMEEATVLH